MGAVKSKLASACPARCECCGLVRSDSYDLRELPRPPQLDTSNGKYNFLYNICEIMLHKNKYVLICK